MRNNDRLQEHTNLKTGKRYYTTTDTNGKHTLTVDAENAYLLRDMTWHVCPVRRGSAKLHARACSNAPRIKRGALLHRRALRNIAPRRWARALDGNLLNSTKANLQSVSRSDATILGRTRRPDKLVGVQYLVPPRWLKSPCHYHARIKMEGKYLRLGSFKSAEEAGSCFDGSAWRLYGKDATTNLRLRLITAKRARTKLLRKAARVGRHKVDQRLAEIRMAKAVAFEADPTLTNFVAMATPREVQPRVVVKSFADAA